MDWWGGGGVSGREWGCNRVGWLGVGSRVRRLQSLGASAELLSKQMHQTMLQMCAAPICAAHHPSQVQILASVPGSCMWNA